MVSATSTDSVRIDVSNTTLFELLSKTYEYFGLRWKVEGKTITIGYEPEQIDHVFDYGKGWRVSSPKLQEQDKMLLLSTD